jgi:hypothetical protein
MDLITENACQLGGVAMGVAAVAALSLLGDCRPSRADTEELMLQQADAFKEAGKKGTFSSGNLKGPIMLGTASLQNTEYFVSSLAEAGISAAILNDSYIAVDLKDFLKDSSTYDENLLYEDLIQSGLLLTPGKHTGVFYCVRMHFDEGLVSETVRRFKTFVNKRSSTELKKENKTVVSLEAVVDSLEELSAEEEGSEDSPVQTPVVKKIAKKTATATKTTGRKRKAGVEEIEDTETDDFIAAVSASALKTPAAKRKSTAVDSVSKDITSTARKGRRKLD